MTTQGRVSAPAGPHPSNPTPEALSDEFGARRVPSGAQCTVRGKGSLVPGRRAIAANRSGNPGSE